MSDHVIRPASSADLEAIVDVHMRARATYYEGRLPEEELQGPAVSARWREGWSRTLASADRQVFCAVTGGRLVGLAELHGPELKQLQVNPADWSRGIGRALHEACVAAWREAGITTACLEVYEHNLRAQAFYARLGWTTERSDAHHLRLRLAVPGIPV